MKGFLSWLGRPRTALMLRIAISAGFVIVVGAAWYKTRGYWSLAWGDPGWLWLAACPVLAMLGAKSVKWCMLLRRLSPEATLSQSFISYLGGIPLSIMTPGRVGEVSRILFLKDRSLLGWSGVGAVLVDKLTDLAALLWWLSVGLFLAGLTWLGAALALAALAVTPLWLWLDRVPRLLKWFPLPKAWKEKIVSSAPAPGVYSPGVILGAVFWGFLSFGVEWVQYWALFNFLAPEVGLGLDAAIAAMTLVTLAGVVQISIAGIGVREGLTALLLWEALPPAASILGSFGVFFFNVALPGGVGLLLKPNFKAADLSDVSK